MTQYANIEFDPTRRPGAAHSDIPEFGGMIEINELPARRFLYSAPDLSTCSRTDPNLDMTILQHHHLPGGGSTLRRIAIPSIVRVHSSKFGYRGWVRIGVGV